MAFHVTVTEYLVLYFKFDGLKQSSLPSFFHRNVPFTVGTTTKFFSTELSFMGLLNLTTILDETLTLDPFGLT